MFRGSAAISLPRPVAPPSTVIVGRRLSRRRIDIHINIKKLRFYEPKPAMPSYYAVVIRHCRSRCRLTLVALPPGHR